MPPVLNPAAAYVALVLAAGFVLGVLRVMVVPRLGAPAAVALEPPVMLAL